MKVLVDVALALLLFVYDNQCPSEQETDWEIEKLLRHEDCNKFYKCTFGKPVEQVCPSDLYFNLDTFQCDWPENVDCSDRNIPDVPSTTLAPTTTTIAPVPTTTSTTVEPSTTSTTTTEPVSTTSTTTTTELTTTSTTTTTPVITTTTATTTTTTTTPTATPDADFLANGCPVDPHVHWLLPHENDCNLFYYCIRGEKMVTDCPSSLHFNREIQVCDWPASAGCTASFNKHLSGRLEIMAR